MIARPRQPGEASAVIIRCRKGRTTGRSSVRPRTRSTASRGEAGTARPARRASFCTRSKAHGVLQPMNSGAARSMITRCPPDGHAATAPAAPAASSSPRSTTRTRRPRSRVHSPAPTIRARLPAGAARRGLDPTANYQPAPQPYAPGRNAGRWRGPPPSQRRSPHEIDSGCHEEWVWRCSAMRRGSVRPRSSKLTRR